MGTHDPKSRTVVDCCCRDVPGRLRIREDSHRNSNPHPRVSGTNSYCNGHSYAGPTRRADAHRAAVSDRRAVDCGGAHPGSDLGCAVYLRLPNSPGT